MPRHKHAEFIIAWAEGERIQWKSPDSVNWTDIRDEVPRWSTLLQYRIKLKPFEGWAAQYSNGSGSHLYQTLEDCKQEHYNAIRHVHMREVEIR